MANVKEIEVRIIGDASGLEHALTGAGLIAKIAMRLNEHLERMATPDALTGAEDRRADAEAALRLAQAYATLCNPGRGKA